MNNETNLLFENIKNFRNGSNLLTEGVSNNDVVSAIQGHEYVYIYYEGDENNQKGYRTIRPYVLGVSKAGNDVIRAWQDRGKSFTFLNRPTRPDSLQHDYWYDEDSKIKPGWRMYRLDRISSFLPTGKKFNKPDGTVIIPPKYKEGSDKDMISISAYVSTKVEPDVVAKTPMERPEKGKWKRFANANINNRKIEPKDITKLYDIAKRVYKKSAGQFIVAINDKDEFELIDVKQKNNIPSNVIVGNLPNLYDTLVKNDKNNDSFFKNMLNKTKNDLNKK